MVRAGWLATGKMVTYPIRNDVDGEGRQLVNWLAEIERPTPSQRDWNRAGRLEDFMATLRTGTSTGSTCPALFRARRAGT